MASRHPPYADDPPPWVQALRRRTASLRALPDVVIIGAMRCGTTACFDLLAGTPHVRTSARKEVHYFDGRSDLGLRWYRSWFPIRAALRVDELRTGVRPRVIEATPRYLIDPEAPRGFAAALPAATALVLLRNPADRTISQWRFLSRSGREPLGLQAAIEAEDAGELRPNPDGRMMPRNLVARSRYDELLGPWLTELGTERVHVVRSEDLFADPLGTVNEIRAAVGLAPASMVGAFRRNDSRPPADHVTSEPEVAAERAELDERFAANVARIEELTGVDLRRSSLPSPGPDTI